ncbi:MAG: hypothetical protein EWM47_13995 [Anaerolineaceae bacterium]|nr:MAG: hypothetical protein EWM47_13995 [Anaerolineaceae bacterium]
MEYKAYKLLFYINAQHSIDNSLENAHLHTFSIGLHLEDKIDDRLIDFNQVSQLVNNYLEQYRGVFLNEMAAFKDLIPTIEHMGNLFYDELKLILTELSYDLIQLDISENPLQIYSVSDRLYFGNILYEGALS